MADLRKKVLGTVSGAVGDLLFRAKNGKNYVGTKPLSFIPGKDEKSIARRQRFAMATRLSKPINSIYKLKSLWKSVTPVGLSPYNQIVKSNYSNVQSDSIGDLVKLVPDIGFSVQIITIDVDQNRLRATINGLTFNSGIDPSVELYFQMVGIMHLSNPSDVDNESHAFLRLVSDEQPLALNTELDIIVNFYDQTSQLISQYQDRKAFLSLLTLDTDRNVINYSNTFFSS
ncbi:MAG: hypothetical protein Q8M94_13870 [Ignavibacteria bacterium]|nr:hypothetical protein [Ignavibacteria bacterium]